MKHTQVSRKGVVSEPVSFPLDASDAQLRDLAATGAINIRRVDRWSYFDGRRL